MARVTLVGIAIVAALCIQHSWAVQYDVGGSQGWEATTDLKTWVSNKQFRVGDSLVFKYTNLHTLDEVDKAGYDSCSTTNAISSATDGNTVMKLTTAGKRYFICGSTGHCPGGMKLEVDILAALATAPATAPVASSSPPPAVASPAPSDGAPTLATIPSSPTPSDGAPTADKADIAPATATVPSSAPVPSTRHTSVSPAASPSGQNGATVNGISSVAVAGAAMVAFFML